MAMDAEERAKQAAEMMDELDSKSDGGAEFVNLPALLGGPSVYPLAAVVGQEAIKSALLLCAVNPQIGGVVISGSRGTCKSVMARATHELLPPIERIKGSVYNIDKESGAFDSFLRQKLQRGEVKLEDLETEVIPCPYVQVPLDVLEDRLLGAIDVTKSVESGETIFEPGLLAQAHRGVLYVDDINLLDEGVTNLLLEALSTRFVTIEREGLSVRHPFEPLLIATFNPEEVELRSHLMDRIGVCLSADAVPLEVDERLEAVNRALAFSDDPQKFINKYKETMDTMKTSIIFAREYMKSLDLQTAQIQYICEEAIRAGVQGNRGELFARHVARANAALESRDRVEPEDLQMGVKLCIAPRGEEIRAPPDDDEMMGPPPPPPPQPPQQDEEEDEDKKEEEKEEEEQQEEQDQEDTAPPVPEEFMFGIEGVALDPSIMQFANKVQKGKSGSRGKIFSDSRGRYIKPVLPKGRVKKLAIDATMRAAAPFQKKRRERALAEAKRTGDYSKLRGVYIEKSDVRAKKMARNSGGLIIFVVDASGSMALNRMNAAKGAAVNLLNEAYKSRDKISLISFQGDFAQVLLPPTRSITLAKNRLERMPCGGGSPLAHALNQAAQVGLSAQKTGDVGQVMVVCISDGRANVPLSKADVEMQPEEDEAPMDKAALKEEVLNTARSLGSLPSFKLLMLDTENKFVSTGIAKDIAKAAQGRYHYIPKASDQAIKSVASQAIKDLKRG